MEVTLRQATVADIPTLARIFAEAFRSIDEPHGFFFPDLVSVEAGTQMITSGVSTPGIYGVVAQILGSNFMDERDAVRGIGPISVDPKVQNRGLGRRLMQAVLERARGAVSAR